MPVTADDFLWEATGFNSSGTSVVVTHPDAGGTTAGTTVVIGINAVASAVTMPAGFVLLATTPALMFVYAKSNVAASETSWTFTLNLSGSSAWYMLEVDNVALVVPADGSSSTSGTTGNGATRSTGSATNAGSSGLALAVYYAHKVGANDAQSWSGWTNSFTERVDVAPAAGTAGRQMAVAWRTYDALSTWETTATFATSAGTPGTGALMVLLRSSDASINAPLSYLTGFEFGTHGGLASSTSPVGVGSAAGTFGTNYLVQAGSARSGGYGLRVVASASVANVQLPTLTANTFAFGGNVKAVSGSGTPIALFLNTNQSDLALLYDVTNEKFGLRWNVATTEWQTGTTPVGTWAWVDIRAMLDSSVHHADWAIETGTGDGSQTSPADVTGAAVATAATDVYLGHLNSQTATFDYDDIVYSRYAAAYPLRVHVVRLLVPETTGATVSGTSTNFSRFTANGTLAAITADTAGALLDEVPPTVSASSDGVVQTAVAASDYLNLPMTTYTCTSSEVIAGVRFVASEWGGTGSGTGTLGWRGYDGTTETTFQAAGTLYDADSLTAISATYPRWATAMWSGGASGAWTQTRLNAAAIRMGFSTDATPDMGASAVYLEVATRATPVYRQITTGEADEFTVDLRVDPYNSASVSYLLESTDATRGATFYYSISGTPQTPVYVNPSDTEEVVVNAASFGEISDVSLEPDPVV